MKEKIKWFVILHIIILIYSLSGISSKTAASYDFLSLQWIIFYGLVVCILGFYAIAWQQVLKHLPLITTYANKAVTTIWGLIWGLLVFGEAITPQKVIGAAVVIFGVYLVVSGDEEVNSKKNDEEVKEND
ncbi:DMT family transporter [Pseudobutyrivibrio sp.]|uniref:DMT family transporter n=1 Tax=Pseudobutyrivibrio sp. TaxID=2014367 RepID=UPI001D5C567A|nr:DMT family transporter [Pseudobutyrivibrio sp.]MBE5909865.1 DMT family transporter [Pseudobutyrivibrio sp.]